MDKASLEALAADLEVIDEAVFETNVPVVEAFLAVSTQWRTALQPKGMGVEVRWIGLDYQGAKVALDAFGIEMIGDLFAGLQVMEFAAIAALNGSRD